MRSRSFPDLRVTQMPLIQLLTVTGVPAFKLQCDGETTVAKLQMQAAKMARVNKLIWQKMRLVTDPDARMLRLSRGRKFLNPKVTVAALGLTNGSQLTMHIKSTPLVSGAAPLTVNSFSKDGFAFWVEMVNTSGRSLFRIKVCPEDDVRRLLAAAVKRAATVGLGQCEEPSLWYRGKQLCAGKALSYYRLQDSHHHCEVELHGLPGNAVATWPSSPRERYWEACCVNQSHNVLARSSGSSGRLALLSSSGTATGDGTSGCNRLRSAGASSSWTAESSRGRIWMPVGAM